MERTPWRTYRGAPPRILVITFFCLFVAGPILASMPAHRYSFDTNADDSAGTAHGTLLGAAVITNGALALNGSNGCVQLPSGMLTNYDSLSVEMWVALNTLSAGARFYLFEWFPTNGITSMVGGGNSSRYYTVSQSQTVPTPFMAPGGTNHIVWTQDQSLHTARIFTNGVLAAQNTNFTLTPKIVGLTTNNFIGAYRTNSGVINGSILEFRVYSNALSALEISQAASAGPDVVPQLQAVRLVSPPYVPLGARPGQVIAEFSPFALADITGQSGVALFSSDTNVISVAPDGFFKALALGTSTLAVEYGELSDSKTVSVVSDEGFDLIHRYNFLGTPGNTNVADVQTGADGGLTGGIYTNNGSLYLNGFSGHVNLPDGILSSLTEVTLEGWVTRYAPKVALEFWPRVFDFGSQETNGTGSSYFFLSHAVASDNMTNDTDLIRFAVSTNWIYGESPRLTTHPRMPVNLETHFAVTYSPSHNLSKLYINGSPVAAGPASILPSMIVDTNNWLGRSQFTGDSYFHGLFNEFRIYKIALNDADIAASHQVGPDTIGADFVLHTRISEGNLIISWGPDAYSGVLKSSPTLGPDAEWVIVPVSPAFTNGRFEASAPIGDATRFYGLFFP